MKQMFFVRKRFWLGLLGIVTYIVLKYGVAAGAAIVAAKWGIWICCFYLTVTHAVLSVAQLYAYDHTGATIKVTAWIKRIKMGDLRQWHEVYLQMLFNRGGKAMFVFLSTQFDAALTTAYTRDTEGLKWSTQTTFLVSFSIGIAYSTLVYSGIGKTFMFVKSLFA